MRGRRFNRLDRDGLQRRHRNRATYLPDAGAKAVFGKHIPVIAGQGAPRGRAVADGDGYRLSGQWSYGSGLLHAISAHWRDAFREWQTEPCADFHRPRKQVNFLGNWDVVGLRATGSVDYALDNVYVPKDFTIRPTRWSPFAAATSIAWGSSD